MEREEQKILQKIRDNGGEVYSISRLNTINQCPYQAYLQYIKGVSSNPSIWGSLGGSIHDVLEKCIHREIINEEDALLKAIDEELDYMNTLGVDFPLDRNGNPTIRNNWVADMKGFAKHFKTPSGKFETEKFVLYKISEDSYMQGYIDLIRYNEDGSIDIYDWKTSSQFDKDHLVQAGRQLIFYMLAMQEENPEYIIKSINWVMLKYATVSWLGKNGKTQTKTVEWRKLGPEMKKKIEKDMIAAGYNDIDIEMRLQWLIEDNDLIRQVPEIKERYTLSPYVRNYEITDERIQETLDYIKSSIEKFKAWGKDEKAYKPLDCYEESFFCNNLCGFGKEKCKHYADYLVECEINEDEIDELFS